MKDIRELNSKVFKGKAFQLVPSVTCSWKDSKYSYSGSVSSTARLRTVLDDEIIIEFDTERSEADFLISETVRNLTGKYTFYVYDHNGRSPHIHIYNIKYLDALPVYKRKEYKKLFLHEYAPFDSTDTTLAGEHLVALEFAPHFKHGSVKELVYYSNGRENNIELDLLKKIRTSSKVFDNVTVDVKAKWLLDWLSSVKLKRGARDLLLYKNAVIIIKNNGLNKNFWFKKISERQEPENTSRVLVGLNGWWNWANAQPTRFFSHEIKKYCDRFGYDFDKVKKGEF